MRPRVLGAVVVAICLAGCTRRPTPQPPAVVAPAVEPKKDDAGHPTVKEARADTEAVLNDLLAGKYDGDPSYAPVARKLKGYNSWQLDSQRLVPDNPAAVEFDGTLKGTMGDASFTASMRKQQNGKWMIGAFSGPNGR